MVSHISGHVVFSLFTSFDLIGFSFGCQGAECNFCHDPHPHRPVTFDKRLRDILASWSQARFLDPRQKQRDWWRFLKPGHWSILEGNRSTCKGLVSFAMVVPWFFQLFMVFFDDRCISHRPRASMCNKSFLLRRLRKCFFHMFNVRWRAIPESWG